MVKVIEYLEGHYTTQEAPFGVVYKWSPEGIVMECRCGAKPTLTASRTICSGCGVDHAKIVRRELNGSQNGSSQKKGDKVHHPWHFTKREDVGLHFGVVVEDVYD